MEKDVTRGIEEQLSAFLDGELPEEEVALLVRRLERDDTYRLTLTSYAAIGGVLRNEPRELGSARFREGVLNAIDAVEAEPGEAAPGSGTGKRMPYALVATAAAIGVVAVLAGVFRPQSVSSPPAAPAVAAVAVPVSPPVQPVSAAAERSQSVTVAADTARVNRQRMTSYLISHGQQSGSFPGAFGDSRMYVQQASFTE